MMTAYIGPKANLVTFPCPSSVEVGAGPRSSFMTTLGGRVIEQRGPSPKRTWQVGLGVARPNKLAELEALVAGVFGAPPWVWMSPDAISQNMMTPDSSLLEAGTYSRVGIQMGPRTATDGTRIPRTVGCLENNDVDFGTANSGHRTPVRVGDLVTGSLYAEGPGTLTLIFFNSAGGWTAAHNRNLDSSWGRYHITREVPEGTVEAVLRVTGTTGTVVAGAPALTMTAGPMPWAVGKGCVRATVDGLDTSVVRAVPGVEAQNLSRHAFTIRELG